MTAASPDRSSPWHAGEQSEVRAGGPTPGRRRRRNGRWPLPALAAARGARCGRGTEKMACPACCFDGRAGTESNDRSSPGWRSSRGHRHQCSKTHCHRSSDGARRNESLNPKNHKNGQSRAAMARPGGHCLSRCDSRPCCATCQRHRSSSPGRARARAWWAHRVTSHRPDNPDSPGCYGSANHIQPHADFSLSARRPARVCTSGPWCTR